MDTLSRDPGLERELLALASELNQRCHGESAGPYARVVFERLTLGAERYPNDAFLTRDNLVELLEETPDIAGYTLLELERLRPTVSELTWQELRMAAVAVIAAGIHADVAARRFQRLRDGR